MIDCLIIGFNDTEFEDYVNMVRRMGTDSGAYRDLNLHFIEYNGKPYRSMDILNHFCCQGEKGEYRPFHNADFLWPVVVYLGTYLSRRGLSFDYVNLFHFERDKLREKLVNNDILTIAITTTLYVAPHPILEIMPFVREYNSTARIIVGGPYVLNQVRMSDRATIQTLFKYIGADFYVISSEGEFALVNIINALRNGSSLDDIDNIAYRKGKDYVFTADVGEANSLEENMVDYSLFPKGEIGEFVSPRTSRSCPFACAFCGFPERAGKYRYLSVELVEKELDAIRDIGTVTTLTFIDDTFNVPKKRFKEILRMIIRNRYGFKWNCQYRCDHGDEETIELMKEAGCEGVFLGVESGSDDMLQMMNKTARRKDYLAAIPRLREVGISTHANLVVGFPGETYESVRETIELIEETRPYFFRAQLWYCDPMTPIWRKRKECRIRGSAFEWSHTTMDSRTACDLIEKMFLSIENSLWLPQNGFELWSTFYLQRKGMTFEQVRTFLKCFNAIVKDKLICPEKEAIDPDLLNSLIESCRFADLAQPDMRPVQIRSGAGYVDAERFWIRQFGDRPPTSNIELWREEIEASNDKDARWVHEPCALERPMLDSLCVKYQAELSSVFLAAYSVLLSRLNGREDITIASAIGEKGVVPLRLCPFWDLGFGEFVENVQQKIQKATEHQLYAFHILANPLRMAEYNASCPVLDVGYAFYESEEGKEENGLEEVLQLYPAVDQGMGLVLEVTGGRDDIKVQFLSRQGWLGQETVGKLSSYLASILEEISENTDVLLGDIMLDSEREDRVLVTAIDPIDPGEVFKFREL